LFCRLCLKDERKLALRQCKKARCVVLEVGSLMHKSLQLTYVTFVTCPWRSFPKIIVTESTVHSMRRMLQPVSHFQQCIRIFWSPVIKESRLILIMSLLLCMAVPQTPAVVKCSVSLSVMAGTSIPEFVSNGRHVYSGAAYFDSRLGYL
jgi:hypothetical protein